MDDLKQIHKKKYLLSLVNLYVYIVQYDSVFM